MATADFSPIVGKDQTRASPVVPSEIKGECHVALNVDDWVADNTLVTVEVWTTLNSLDYFHRASATWNTTSVVEGRDAKPTEGGKKWHPPTIAWDVDKGENEVDHPASFIVRMNVTKAKNLDARIETK